MGARRPQVAAKGPTAPHSHQASATWIGRRRFSRVNTLNAPGSNSQLDGQPSRTTLASSPAQMSLVRGRRMVFGRGRCAVLPPVLPFARERTALAEVVHHLGDLSTRVCSRTFRDLTCALLPPTLPSNPPPPDRLQGLPNATVGRRWAANRSPSPPVVILFPHVLMQLITSRTAQKLAHGLHHACVMAFNVQVRLTWWQRADKMVTRGQHIVPYFCHAHCKSGTQSMASHSTHLSIARAWTNSGDPTGVPKIFAPVGLHTSSPKSAPLGQHTPALFQNLVLPSFGFLPFCAVESEENYGAFSLSRGWKR